MTNELDYMLDYLSQHNRLGQLTIFFDTSAVPPGHMDEVIAQIGLFFVQSSCLLQYQGELDFSGCQDGANEYQFDYDNRDIEMSYLSQDESDVVN